MKFWSMWVLFFSLLCGTVSAFQYSRLVKGAEVSLARCMEDPRSCSAGVDEMRETASMIKTEVLAELNATRKRLHQIASDFVGCISLTSQVSSYRSAFQAKVKSHTLCRKQQQHVEDDVSMTCAKYFDCDESQSNSTVREGKSDCKRRRSRANLHAFMPRKHWACGWRTWPKSSARGTLSGRKIMSFVSRLKKLSLRSSPSATLWPVPSMNGSSSVAANLSVESFSCSWATASQHDAPRTILVLHLFL